MKWYECQACGEEIVFEVCRCGSSDEHRTARLLQAVLPEILETILEIEKAVFAAEKAARDRDEWAERKAGAR